MMLTLGGEHMSLDLVRYAWALQQLFMQKRQRPNDVELMSLKPFFIAHYF
jgi:hypothetical protein